MGPQMPRLRWSGLIVLVALLMSLGIANEARADNTAECASRMSSYVAELDPLFDEYRLTLTPFIDLNDRYFPFLDCDAEPLIQAAAKSRFFREAPYDSLREEFLFIFSSKDIEVTFLYQVKPRTSFFPGVGFLSKCDC